MKKARLSSLVLLTILSVSLTGCGSKPEVTENVITETESVVAETQNEAVSLQVEEADVSYEENISAEDSALNDTYTEYSTDSFTISIPKEWVSRVRAQDIYTWFYPEYEVGSVINVMLQLQKSHIYVEELNEDTLESFSQGINNELVFSEMINIGDLGDCAHFRIKVAIAGTPTYMDGVLFKDSDNILQLVTFMWGVDYDNQYLDEWDYIFHSIKLNNMESTSDPNSSETIAEAVDAEIVDESVAANDTSTSGSTTSLQYKAINKAKDYLKYYAFSRDGLVNQLVYVGFSADDAGFGADNCGADWNKEALEKAQEYLKFTAFSCSGLAAQLEFEKFTAEQAGYGADNCGADWNTQAAKKAKEYLEYFSLSKEELIDQLEYEKFTTEQAEYGVAVLGY